jgi:hypothetical protein
MDVEEPRSWQDRTKLPGYCQLKQTIIRTALTSFATACPCTLDIDFSAKSKPSAGFANSYCVGLYYTFALSYRDIEKMMLYRGIEVTYETIREWCQKYGQQYANQVRRKRSYVTDKWHLDEMVVTIKKQQYYL